MKRQFRLPDPGEGLVEAEIVAWRVTVGETIEINDVLVEIETSKSLVELPSPYAGEVTGLLVEEGSTVEVGTPIVEIEDGEEALTYRHCWPFGKELLSMYPPSIAIPSMPSTTPAACRE